MERMCRWAGSLHARWATLQAARAERRSAGAKQGYTGDAPIRSNLLLGAEPIAATDQLVKLKGLRGVFAGRVELVDTNYICGFVLPEDGASSPEVELRIGGNCAVKVAVDDTQDVNGGRSFVISYSPNTRTSGTIHRMPDGAELHGSPILLQPSRALVPRPRPTDARIKVVKAPPAVLAREVALLVSHVPSSEVRSHVLPYVSALAANGVDVILVLASDVSPEIPARLYDLCAGLVVRENAGYDFAAWAHLLKTFPRLFAASTLIILNDSVVGRFGDGHFANMLDRVRRSEAHLIGLTSSKEHRAHIQSYFLALKGELLFASELLSFFDDVVVFENKDEVIRSYELTFTEAVQKAGFACEVLFDSLPGLNPTLHDWKRLLHKGFPFVKLSIPAGKFPEIDTSGWQAMLAAAGFDTACIENAIGRSTGVGVPVATLSANAAEPPVQHLAYFGPWNQGPCTGAASHFVIAALRCCAIELNLYPLAAPGKSLAGAATAPLLPICDFIGAPCIVILHMPLHGLLMMEPSWRDCVHPAAQVIWYDDGEMKLGDVNDQLPGIAAAFGLSGVWSVRPVAIQARSAVRIQPILEIDAIPGGRAGIEQLAISIAHLIGAPLRSTPQWT